MRRAAALIEVSTRSGDVIHLMQVERGASVTGDQALLAQARSALDGVIRTMRASVDSLDDLTGDDRALALQELQALDTLATVRQGVDQHGLTSTQFIAQYTGLIEKLMNLATVGVQRATHADLTRQMTAQLALLCEKEFAGRERAQLAAALAQQSLDEAARRKVLEGIGRQQSCLSQFSALADPGLRDAYVAVSATPAYQDAVDMREKILQVGPAQSGITKDAWFAAATSRMEAFKGMLDTFSHAMIAQAEGLKDAASQRALLSVGLALLAEPVEYALDGRGDWLAHLILSELAAADTVPLAIPWPRDRRLVAVCSAIMAAPGSRQPAQDGPHPGHDLRSGKWFYNVIVSADFQSNDTVHFFALRRNHNDRHRVALATQTTTNGETIFARQHQIQHHQVEGLTSQQAIHLFSVGDASNLEALLGQITFEQRTQAHVVIHNQNLIILLHCLYSQRFTAIVSAYSQKSPGRRPAKSGIYSRLNCYKAYLTAA
nr:nitrate- and nitrite sensing domain-containing protein [Rivihabitans pingtungensis]